MARQSNCDATGYQQTTIEQRQQVLRKKLTIVKLPETKVNLARDTASKNKGRNRSRTFDIIGLSVD